MHVRAGVDPLAGGLLGRHVGGCPDDLRQPAGVDHRLGHAEVRDQQPGLARRGVGGPEQQVLRLDVAVDDPLPVQHGETRRRLVDEVHDLLDRQPSPVLQQARQRAAIGVRHDEERGPVDLADVVDADDVVGVGPAQDPGLLEEAVADVHSLRPVVGEALDRDVGGELVVVVEPDGGEPARPDPVHAPESTETLREGHARYCA